MTNPISFPISNFYSNLIKFLMYSTATLYLSSFGLHGTNLMGLVDSLIPVERAVLTLFGLGFLALTTITLTKITKQYLEIIKMQKKQIFNITLITFFILSTFIGLIPLSTSLEVNPINDIGEWVYITDTVSDTTQIIPNFTLETSGSYITGMIFGWNITGSTDHFFTQYSAQSGVGQYLDIGFFDGSTHILETVGLNGYSNLPTLGVYFNFTEKTVIVFDYNTPTIFTRIIDLSDYVTSGTTFDEIDYYASGGLVNGSFEIYPYEGNPLEEVYHVSFPFDENGVFRYQVNYGAILTVTETQNRDLYCDHGTILTVYAEPNEGYFLYELNYNMFNSIRSGEDITITEDTEFSTSYWLYGESEYPINEDFLSYINISPPTNGYIWININGIYHNYTSTSSYDTLNVPWNTRVRIGYVSQDAYILNRFYTNINEYFYNESDYSITFDSNYTLSLENDFYIIFGYPWDTDIYPDGIFNYIVDIWATLILPNGATPPPYNGATVTPNPQIATFETTFFNYLAPLLFLLAPAAAGAITLGKFGAAKWGFITGLNIGAILCYLYVTGFGLWAVIIVVIIDALMIFSTTRQGGE